MKNIRVNFTSIRIAVLILFILMQFFLIFIKKHYTLDTEVGPNTTPSPNIHRNIRIGQTFIAQRDNLARLDLMLGTHDRENNQDVFFELWDVESRETVVKKTFNASTVMNNRYNSVEFRPIKNSEGEKFRFNLASPQSTLENSISIWMNKKDIYPHGDYLLNNNISRGDLVFRVYSKRPVYTELGRIVRHYEGIFGSKAFLIVAIIFFEIVQILLLWSLLGFIHRNWKSP